MAVNYVVAENKWHPQRAFQCQLLQGLRGSGGEYIEHCAAVASTDFCRQIMGVFHTSRIHRAGQQVELTDFFLD